MTSAALPSAPSSLDAPRPLTTYRGCCHCQSTIFRVTLPSLSSTSAANLRCACALCAKRGALWARAPRGALVFERGRNALRAYSADDPEAGTDGETQYYCGTCGTLVLGAPYAADREALVNIRAIRDIDAGALPTTPCALHATAPASLPALVHPFVPATDETVYSGNCPCGAIRFALLSPNLPAASHAGLRVAACSCSICAGNGVVWLYPALTHVFFAPAGPPPAALALTPYFFGKKTNGHHFCGACGANVYERRPQSTKGTIGLNLRLVDGLDLASVAVRSEDRSGGYVVPEVDTAAAAATAATATAAAA